MEYLPFYYLFPKIAKKEKRSITLSKSTKLFPSLPPGRYTFTESYCTALDDCKRVFLNIFYEGDEKKIGKKSLATIGFGWDTLEYYRKYWKDLIEDGLITAKDMKGPNLEKGQFQSRYANDLLKIAEKYVCNDKKYIDRLAKHSSMVDKKIIEKNRLK